MIGLAARYGLGLTGWNGLVRLACLLAVMGSTWLISALALSRQARQMAIAAANRCCPPLATVLTRFEAGLVPGAPR